MSPPRPERPVSEPHRTCILTRQRLPRAAMLRVVADGSGRLRVDLDGKLHGRGAWVRPELDLLAQLQQRPSLAGRSLRLKNLQSSDPVAQARAGVHAGVLGALAECRRAGVLVSGARQLADAGMLPVVVVAQGVAGAGWSATLVVELPLSPDELGARIGRGPRAAIGARDSRPTRRLAQWLQRGVWLGYPPR